MRKRKSRFVVMTGSKIISYTPNRKPNTINAILAREYRQENNVRVGRLRPKKRKRKRSRRR